MGNPKWYSGFGLALAADAADEPSAPTVFPIAESGKISIVPRMYERQVAFAADVDHVVTTGFEYGFSLGNVQPDAETFGRILWLALGSDGYAVGKHQIVPAADAKYLNFFLDYQEDIGADQVQRLIGAKITGLSFEQPEQDIAKLNVSGAGLDLGTPLASLSPSIPTGDDNEPMGWKALQQAGSFVELSLNGGAYAQDDSIQSFGFDYARTAIPSGTGVGQNQPTKLDNGIRNVSFKFTKEFYGASATAQVNAFLAQQRVGMKLRWEMGSTPYYVELYIPNANFSGDPLPAAGQEEDVLKLEFTAKAFRDGSTPVIYAYVVDSTAAAYSD